MAEDLDHKGDEITLPESGKIWDYLLVGRVVKYVIRHKEVFGLLVLFAYVLFLIFAALDDKLGWEILEPYF